MATTNLCIDIADRIRVEWTEIENVMKVGVARGVTIGKLLIQVKGRLKHGEFMPWVERQKFPFKRSQANNFMLLAKRVHDLGNSQHVGNLPMRDALRMLAAPKDGPHVAHNSGQNEWYTPEPYIKAATDLMGAIDLDPASSAEANKIVKAKRFFSAADDGLCKKWTGRVWMNPPYAGELIGAFIDKLCESFMGESVTEACVLVNNATETKWFKELAKHASAIVFTLGRVKFWQPGKDSAAPLQGQAVAYLGAKPDRFAELFEPFESFGMVWPAKAGAAAVVEDCEVTT